MTAMMPSYSLGVCQPIRQACDALGPLRHRPPSDFPGLLDHGATIAHARALLDHAQTVWAVNAAVSGASWKQIGDTLGISKQAAQQRYGSMLVERPLPGTDE